MAPSNVYVPVGELRVSKNLEVKLTTVTASCVALGLYEAQNRTAGVLHVVLPGRRLHYRSSPEPSSPYYADTGVHLLIREMTKLGAIPDKMVATVVGGATLLRDSDGREIGVKNSEMIKTLLQQAEIPIVEESTGGNVCRRLALEVATGRVLIQAIEQNGPADIKAVFETEAESKYPEQLSKLLEKMRPSPTFSGKLLQVMHQSVEIIDWDEAKLVIARDFVLGLHFFRTVNSPYYGIPGEISTFEQALAKLGVKRLRQVCILTSVMRRTEDTGDDNFFPQTGLSQHCLTTAVIARYLCMADYPQFSEDAFTAGLLHGIDSLSCIFSKKKTGVAVRKPLNSSVTGNDHKIYSQVSGILNSWRLPQHIIAAIASCRSPVIEDKINPNLAPFVFVGCALSNLLGMTTALEDPGMELTDELLGFVGLKSGIYGIVPKIQRLLKAMDLLDFLNLDTKI